jgi:hypothetical protein
MPVFLQVSSPKFCTLCFSHPTPHVYNIWSIMLFIISIILTVKCLTGLTHQRRHSTSKCFQNCSFAHILFKKSKILVQVKYTSDTFHYTTGNIKALSWQKSPHHVKQKWFLVISKLTTLIAKRIELNPAATSCLRMVPCVPDTSEFFLWLMPWVQNDSQALLWHCSCI